MWPRELFEARNVTYEPAETPKSDLYRDIVPLLNAPRGSINVVAGVASVLGSESWYWRNNHDGD
jgi:hypothetical protein